nr:MAG TPA: hypothetical protein [Caudoviricetes sp.]
MLNIRLITKILLPDFHINNIFVIFVSSLRQELL